MKRLLAALCVFSLVAAGAPDAEARWGSRSSGGGHSSKSKSSGGYIVRHCKTQACFKKHPSGEYGFYPGKKRK